MKSEVTISGNRLQVKRSFDAPRPLVFSWWTTPEKLRQWSGCKEATKCEIDMDFRVGGSFAQKLQITGRGEFTIFGTYEEIIEPERIVYRAIYGPVTTRVTVEFFVEGKGNKLLSRKQESRKPSARRSPMALLSRSKHSPRSSPARF